MVNLIRSSVMSLGTRSTLARTTLRLVTIAAGVVGGVACQAKPRIAAPPIASALVVRNLSAFDINVYAVTRDGGRDWLLTVPAKALRALPVEPRMLRASSELVIVAQSVGASAQCTTNAVAVSANVFGMLDLVTTRTGNCSASALYSVTAGELQAAMR
jgi:hypothetical protein